MFAFLTFSHFLKRLLKILLFASKSTLILRPQKRTVVIYLVSLGILGLVTHDGSETE